MVKTKLKATQVDRIKKNDEKLRAGPRSNMV